MWNGVLDHADNWEKTIIHREFRSSDHGYKHKYPAFTINSIVTLDEIELEKFWIKTSERVEALKRIDELKQHIRDDIVRRIGRMREDHFNDCVQNRNVRRQLMMN